MLEDSLFESQGRKKIANPITVIVSVVAHVVTIGVLVLIPLLQTQAITLPAVDMSLWLPRAEPQRNVEAAAQQPRVQKQVRVDPNDFIAPQAIPTAIPRIVDAPADTAGFLPSTGDGNRPGSLLRELLNRQPEMAPPAPPPTPVAAPPAPPPVDSAPIRKFEGLQRANLIHQVNPAFPPLAIQARVQGVVVLEAIISREGSIESLRVVSGHPLLNPAALEAVKQWKYRPTLLNGQAVEVITTITIHFTLQ